MHYRVRNDYVHLGYFHAFICASASIISSFLAKINHLLTNTYKSTSQTVDPKVARSSHVCLVFQVSGFEAFTLRITFSLSLLNKNKSNFKIPEVRLGYLRCLSIISIMSGTRLLMYSSRFVYPSPSISPLRSAGSLGSRPCFFSHASEMPSRSMSQSSGR